MSIQQITLLDRTDDAPVATLPPDDVSAGMDLQRDLLNCSRFLALLAAELERADSTSEPRATVREVLEAELVTALSSPPGDLQSGKRGIDAGAEVARLVEEALGRLEGRSEEEQRLRDWIDLLQGAALPLIQQLPLRPGFAGKKSSGGCHSSGSAQRVAWNRARVRGTGPRLSIVPHEENQGMKKPEQVGAERGPAGAEARAAPQSTGDSATADLVREAQPESTPASEPTGSAARRGLRVLPGRTPLSEARAAQIRERILQGAYNSLAIVDEVARRMLRRGDI